MALKRVALLWAVCGLSAAVGGCVSCLGTLRSRRAEALVSRETTNGVFKIRVTSFREKNLAPGPEGTYYVFSSTAKNRDSWQEVMMLRHDDRPELPLDGIRFEGESIGYAFMEWMYGVTTDSGRTWSVWNAPRDVGDWNWVKYGVIRDVQLSADGSG